MAKKATKQSAEIMEYDIRALRDIDDIDAAEVYDARMRSLEVHNRRSFVETGLICAEVISRSLWAKLAAPGSDTLFPSFHDWVESATGYSSKTVYEAIRAVETLKVISYDDLRAMARCNIWQMARLSTALQGDADVIEAAKSMKESGFVAFLQERYPDQHIESQRAMQLMPTSSQRPVIEEAISLCMRIEHCSKTAALERICIGYLQEHQRESAPEADYDQDVNA